MLSTLGFQAIGSPEYETHGPVNFTSWNEKYPNATLNHDGMPTVWNFRWQKYNGTKYDRCGFASSKKSCIGIERCGWCSYDSRCSLGYKDGPALGVVCEAGWSVKVMVPKWAVPFVASISAITFVFVGLIVAYNVKLGLDDKGKHNQEKKDYAVL
jgi:hypothetical protein